MNRCRILKGDKLRDLPIERPRKFELAVDVKKWRRLSISRLRGRSCCAPMK
jgi:hypothetical protein